MKSRSVAIGIALVLALVATLALSVYISGVKKRAQTGGGAVTVVVAKEDIPSGTRLDPLIDQGQFTTKSVPSDLRLKGAVTDLTQLRHQVTSAPIFAGEQMTTDRLGTTTLGGGALGIRQGYEALTVELSTERTVAGSVHQGDHVTIYATFKDVNLVPPSQLRQFLAGKVTGSAATANVGDWTVTLVPDARVLKVDSGTTTSDKVDITLELTARDAQRLVFAQNNGDVWLGLLAPGQTGQAEDPVTTNDALDLRGGGK